MTDAGRAMVGGQITEAAVDGLLKTCDCTIGKTNLLKGNGTGVEVRTVRKSSESCPFFYCT